MNFIARPSYVEISSFAGTCKDTRGMPRRALNNKNYHSQIETKYDHAKWVLNRTAASFISTNVD